MGVTIRHWFNTQHARAGAPHWTWAVTALLFLLIAWLSIAPMGGTYDEAEARPLSGFEQRFASHAQFEAASDIVLGRCSMCHAREPVWDGLHWAPKGVYLETSADIARHAEAIYLQAGVSHAMPPANLTYMTPEERQVLAAWYRDAR